MAVPKDYYGKIFPRSGLLKNHCITCDAGVIDVDYRGTVDVLLVNYNTEHYTRRTGERIAQMVFMKKIDVNFGKVSELHLLGETKLEIGAFGSKGMVEILSVSARKKSS